LLFSSSFTSSRYLFSVVYAANIFSQFFIYHFDFVLTSQEFSFK
jgi:hypothetical protein